MNNRQYDSGPTSNDLFEMLIGEHAHRYELAA